MVAESAAKPENARLNTGGATSGEWFARRIKNQRINNRTVGSVLHAFPSTTSEIIAGPRDMEGQQGN